MTLELAHNQGGTSVPAGGFTRDDIAPGAGVPVVRRGASFPAAGGYLDATWGPSTTTWGFRFDVLWSSGQSGVLVGRDGVVGRGVVFVGTSGALTFRDGATNFVVTGDVLPDGAWAQVEVSTTPTEATVTVDGVVAASSTFGAVAWATSAFPYGIGANQTGGSHATGVMLRDVWFIDPASDASTAHFPLDALNASGAYPNEHPNSTVGDATVTGTVLPVEVNAVTPGSAAPVPVGPVVVMGLRTATQSFSASGTIGLSGTPVDPYGWLSGPTIESPLAGVGVVEITGRMRATALSGSDDVQVTLNQPGIGATAVQPLTLDTVNEWVGFAITVGIQFAAGDSFNVRIEDIAGTTTVEADDAYWTLTLYPDLSA